MKSSIAIQLFLCLLLSNCTSTTKQQRNPAQAFKVTIDSLPLFDQSRNRLIPVALYGPETTRNRRPRQVIIFSHGYGANKGGDNTAYSYLTRFLASQGYVVASIQHELPTDELLPTTGKPQETRRPNWERGVQNILFVSNELKRTKPGLDYRRVVLIGHSNGGDMSMLFAHKYPTLVDKVISLDNRRMSLPRTKMPKIYSLRSNDQPADEGVLPTPDEQQKFGIEIIKLANTTHNQMDDKGNADQHAEINRYILSFIKN